MVVEKMSPFDGGHFSQLLLMHINDTKVVGSENMETAFCLSNLLETFFKRESRAEKLFRLVFKLKRTEFPAWSIYFSNGIFCNLAKYLSQLKHLWVKSFLLQPYLASHAVTNGVHRKL